jgi:hypothetical protein
VSRLILLVVMTGIFAGLSGRADDGDPKRGDPFAHEPERARAKAPIHFLESFDEARAEAKTSGKLIFAYFTADFCGWCRVLEKRTFTDAEVVAMSRRCVCVELNTTKDAVLADRFRIDSIPRCFLLTADGREIDHRSGYIPAAEFAEWFQAALAKGPAPAADANRSDGAPKRPEPVGASESEADLVLWYVDNSRSVERWRDPETARHPILLALLRRASRRPRVEHMGRADFPGRWEQAEAAGRVPDLIAADQHAGLVRDLDRRGRLTAVICDRLTVTPENAACPDFKARFLGIVHGAPHEANARAAVRLLIQPGPESGLPGDPLPDQENPEEAAEVARRAVGAYFRGDTRTLKEVAARGSSQLARCTKPAPWLEGMEVATGATELRGNGHVAFARVEASFQGKTSLGGEAVLVVLQRESGRWKALTISRFITSVAKELPKLCLLPFESGPASGEGPAKPRLIFPLEGGLLDRDHQDLTWEIPQGGEVILAQVCEVQFGERNASWPETALKVFPGGSGHKIPATQAAPGPQTSWCVWAIARSGRVSVSEAPTYGFRGEP